MTTCAMCGGPLSGRRTRYCSDPCQRRGGDLLPAARRTAARVEGWHRQDAPIMRAPLPPLQGPACHGHDPDLWFPLDEEQSKAARAVCARCPVQTACLQHALDVPALVGVWGGTTTDQRRRMRTARNRTNEGSTHAAG